MLGDVAYIISLITPCFKTITISHLFLGSSTGPFTTFSYVTACWPLYETSKVTSFFSPLWGSVVPLVATSDTKAPRQREYDMAYFSVCLCWLGSHFTMTWFTQTHVHMQARSRAIRKCYKKSPLKPANIFNCVCVVQVDVWCLLSSFRLGFLRGSFTEPRALQFT